MATKAEMQAAFERCEQVRGIVGASLHQMDYFGALKHACTGLPHQHAAVSFQRRFQNVDSPTAPLVDLILRFAPACFMGRALDEVEAWFASGTKTERGSISHMPVAITDARHLLAYAVDLWGVLSRSPASVLRITPNQQSKILLHVWLSIGAVAAHPAEPHAYVRVTDPRRNVVAKCTSCGGERYSTMTETLEPSTCTACGRRSNFVLVRRSAIR